MGLISEAANHRLKREFGPWAVVTGASSGIGKELAFLLAAAGLDLVLCARRRSVLDETARECSAHGIETIVVEADLSTKDGLRLLAERIDNLDVGLFIPAAGFGTSGDFLDSELATELEMLELNCRAVLSLTHHFAQKFARRGKGGIVLLSSLVGFQGVPRAAHYAATKAYVQSLGEALAIELRPRGVTVMSAAPGPVASGFAKRAGMEMGKALQPRPVAAEILNRLGTRNTVLPGWLTKVLLTSLWFLPRWGRVRMMGLVMGGMTKHRTNVAASSS